MSLVIKSEQNKQETVNVMEMVLFTNIIEREIKSQPMLSFYNFLDFIAMENKYDARFSKSCFAGSGCGIAKTQSKFIESIKYN